LYYEEPDEEWSNEFCPRTKWSRQSLIDLTDIINDIIIDTLGVFRADTDLDESIENPKRLPAAIGAELDFFAFRAVKRRPVLMPRPLVDHGFFDGQQNRAGHRGRRDISLPQLADTAIADRLVLHFEIDGIPDVTFRIGAVPQANADVADGSEFLP